MSLTIYNTGEEPVLVACNDHNSYICKYSRYSGSANKLVCELMGAIFAKNWMLNTPEIAIVKVDREHVPYNMSGSFFSKPILGSLQQPNVVDITPATIPLISPSEKLCRQLMQIALFDLWLSNEDRNANNANLMYDMVNDDIIDRGRLSIKVDELLSSEWLARVKNGFIETLNTALEQ